MKVLSKNLTALNILLFSCLFGAFAQTKVIFDTDFGGDADDLGALCILHHFIDTKECDLLAVMVWSQEKYAVPAIDAVNKFYGHNEIPIGVRKGTPFYEAWNYCKPIADSFPSELDFNTAADATVLYRQLLAKADDHSIVIVPVGPLANIQNLINSPADDLSPLTGKELIHQKVKEFVVMGGQFPSGENEWNFNGNMPGVTKFVFDNIDVPVILSGFEVGAAIKTGEVFNKIDHQTPLYVGFMHFSKNASWINQDFKGKILNNSTFDQTAVMYAVRKNTKNCWELVNGGVCIPDEKGGNTWETIPNSNHSYLKLIKDPQEMATYIESLMLHNE
ncbi:MAG: nucleoside hydrolase [Prolixibacteraceae bacterium]